MDMARGLYNHRCVLPFPNACSLTGTESPNSMARLARLRDLGDRIVISAHAPLASAHPRMLRRICWV
jgi:hypothetical protein